MKAQVLFIALVLFVGLNSFKSEKKTPDAATAQATMLNNSITGLVIDNSTGEALAGVEINIEGTQLKTYTDFDGKFSFESLQPGDYKVCTKYISYKKKESRSIKVDRNEMHTLNLELKTADE